MRIRSLVSSFVESWTIASDCCDWLCGGGGGVEVGVCWHRCMPQAGGDSPWSGGCGGRCLLTPLTEAGGDSPWSGGGDAVVGVCWHHCLRPGGGNPWCGGVEVGVS